MDIQGIDEIRDFVGTRKEIYHLIAERNPIAIINYREAYVEIGNKKYIIILMKYAGAYKVKIMWNITDGKQYYLNGEIIHNGAEIDLRKK